MLVASLSQAFVAFTIEADNEFETRMPHRTAADRGDDTKTGPWLTSLTYWQNYLRHLPAAGLATRSLARIAGDDASSLASRLHELRRWGYVRVLAGEPGERIVLPTRHGSLARDTWAPVEGLIEERWRERFGGSVDPLKSALAELVGDESLPFGFPILAWDRATTLRRPTESPQLEPGLSTLLARALLLIALDFDHNSVLSLAMAANLIPAIAHPVAVRDLPALTGLSKEAISIGVGRAVRGSLATESDAPKTVQLNPRGAKVAKTAIAQVAELEDRWAARTAGVAAALDAIVGPSLALGLEPPTDGWRARPPYLAQTRAMLADPIAALPRFPMVSHRGGYPDGS